MQILNFIFLSLCLISSLYGENLSHLISQIPIEDIHRMREFADYQLMCKHAAHPLFFNNKSCSLSAIRPLSSDITYEELQLLKDWEIFKKYEHKFRHSNFILSSSLNKSGSISIFIINKRALKKCIGKHKRIFKSVIGKQFSYKWLVTELEENRPLNALIKDNQVLLGILLGYGKKSSQIFEYYIQNPFMVHIVKPEVCDRICSDLPSECECFPVAFVGNSNSKEAQTLRMLYRNELISFWKLYKKKDPLILFLEGFSQNESDILPGLEKSNWEWKYRFPRFVFQYLFTIKDF
jgi:hypothetical protein